LFADFPAMQSALFDITKMVLYFGRFFSNVGFYAQVIYNF